MWNVTLLLDEEGQIGEAAQLLRNVRMPPAPPLSPTETLFKIGKSLTGGK